MIRNEHGAIDWRALHHRWWVEYDPLALVSAAVVLGGLVLLGRDATFDGHSTFILSAVAELYALCLIGGAALLFRIGRQRSAAMLGMLAALFQGDLILHAESSAYLGAVGAAAAVVWWLVFALELRLLAWALRLRLSRSAWLVALVGAAGIAALPIALDHFGATAGRLVPVWLFLTGALGLWTGPRIHSAVPVDVRGRRALRFVWAAWAALALGHAAYWTVLWHVDPTCWPAVGALLAMRYRTRESQRWLLAAVALGGVAFFDPASFGVIALLTGAALALAAWRSPGTRTEVLAGIPPTYRESEDEPETLEVVDRAARARLLLGALTCVYLAAWLGELDLDALPPQPLVALVGYTLVIGWWAERRAQLRWLGALVPFHAQHAVAQGWMAAPSNDFELGLTAVAFGFAALAMSLLTQWHARGGPSRPESARQGVSASELSSPEPSSPALSGSATAFKAQS